MQTNGSVHAAISEAVDELTADAYADGAEQMRRAIVARIREYADVAHDSAPKEPVLAEVMARTLRWLAYAIEDADIEIGPEPEQEAA